MAITFYKHQVKFTIENLPVVKKWVESIVANHHTSIGSLSYIICSDDYLLEINNRFLSHNYFTDIITFPYSAKKEPIVGEIYISIDRVRENALAFNTSQQNEFQRVVIHGVLHLLGYSDKSKAQQKAMRALEDECLMQLQQLIK
jgi:probable rRNA maturation factor